MSIQAPNRCFHLSELALDEMWGYQLSAICGYLCLLQLILRGLPY